ncbi:MAG: UbiA family prenyltransferase, partial [Xanthomonadales bacterium]|nr:UbiA family prenyltransferase [Xanthomonadales bacterium]
HLPQVVLGIAFGWGIPMAFAAETSTIPTLAWWLLAVNTAWSVIYDTLYAMVDREDDLKVGIKSTAILFGRFDLLITGLLMLLMLAMLTAIGLALSLGWPWFIAVLASAVLFGFQLLVARHRQRDACFRAFLANNWVGLALFLGILGHFALSGSYYTA